MEIKDGQKYNKVIQGNSRYFIVILGNYNNITLKVIQGNIR